MAHNDFALQMQEITKIFPGGVVANDRVNLDVKKGEVVGLLGENGAGKTTLMNALYGMFQPTSGRILINGEEVVIDSPQTAIAKGVGMVHQHFKLVDTLTVLENIILGHTDNKTVLDLAPARERVLKLCEEYELFVDPDMEVGNLPVGQRQWVEILKILYRNVNVLVLDEPTAVLTPAESDQLIRAIRKLTGEGRSVIFISHKLREMVEITDRVTVLRNGKYVGTIDTKDANELVLAEMMVGRPVEIVRKPRAEITEKKPVLVLNDLCANDDRGVPALKNLNLTVHAGEIVGVAGVDGNGQKELAECISGLRKITGGSVTIDGKAVTKVISDPSFLGYIPEDRHKTALVLDFSVAHNMVIKEYDQEPYAKKGILQHGTIKDHALELIERFKVKTPNEAVKVRTLSGGNQQKVVIARELNSKPVLAVAAHPTRGLDLGAVDGVLDTLMAERDRGAAVLFISGELQEILAVSDRIIVLLRGESMGIVDGKTADSITVGQMMMGQHMEG